MKTASTVSTAFERGMVLAVLTAVSGGAMADQALHRQLLAIPGPDMAQARRFISRLTRTTLERTITLDFFLDKVAKRPMRSQKPDIAWILRMAAAQILYMDSVPDAAAVHEAVNLAGGEGAGAKAFVNGTLRSFLRQKESFAYPDRKENADRYLQIRYSVPAWIVQEVIRLTGRDRAEEVLAAFEREAPLFIRVNTARISAGALERKLMAAGMRVYRRPEAEGIFLVEDFGLVDGIPGFAEGEFYVQDLSSAAAYRAAGFLPGGSVLDVCGAPGGKSVQAALLMREAGAAGKVQCCDISEKRLERTADNVRRLGLSEITVRQHSAAESCAADEKMYDTVIADVPCSGIGDLRRKPDIKLRVRHTDSRALVPVQRKILAASFPALKPGGRLVYSTCTIAHAENQGNASWFEEHFPVKKRFEKLYLPTDKWPGDGFYAAVFERIC